MSKPHGPGMKADSNGPRTRSDSAQAQPRGPRTIKLKPRTFAQKAEAGRAEREIRARETANYTRLNSTGSERDHAETRRADNRAVAEHQMNQRFRRARVTGA